MPTDKRYIAVKSLIVTGEIKSFRPIFDHIPKKVVYAGLGVNYNRFKKMLAAPDLFTIRELNSLAALFKIEQNKMIELVYSQLEIDKNSKGKK